MKAIALGALAAILVQPLVSIVGVLLYGGFAQDSMSPAYWRDVAAAVLLILEIAAGFILVLGVPAFLLLKRHGRANPLSLGVLGFVMAAIPVAYMTWPVLPAGSMEAGWWFGENRQFLDDGRPTVWGWLRFAEGIVFFGLHGLVGALTLLYVWRRFSVARS